MHTSLIIQYYIFQWPRLCFRVSIRVFEMVEIRSTKYKQADGYSTEIQSGSEIFLFHAFCLALTLFNVIVIFGDFGVKKSVPI